MNNVNILGVRIDVLSKKSTLEAVRAFLDSSSRHIIFTPNPEMLAGAYRHQQMQQMLNASDLNICDGFGITLVSALSKKIPTISHYAGSDCVLDICLLAEVAGKSIFLLGTGNTQTLKKATEQLHERFPRLRIVGTDKGAAITRLPGESLYTINEAANEKIIDSIIASAPDILFVAFGHGKQEWWITRYIQDLPSVKIAMGVGGSIDFIAGTVTRAPVFLQHIGLEWLWRLVLQPWRIGRIITATLIFPYLFFFKQTHH